MYWKSTFNVWDKIDYIDGLNSQFQIEDITSDTVYHCNSINIFMCGLSYDVQYNRLLNVHK